MSSVIHNAPDVTTFAANIVVVLAAIAAAVVGAMSATKTIKKAILDNLKPEPDETTSVSKTQVIGGVLQEAFGSAMLADSLKDNRETNEDLKHAVCSLRDEMRENRHMIERLIDVMRSQSSVR